MSSDRKKPESEKQPRRAEPGAEAAEPSPGESGGSPDDLEQADVMYRKAAKKLADEGAADPKKADEIVKSKRQ